MTRPLRDLAVAGGVTAGNVAAAPLLAGRQDSVTATTGFGLIEDIETLVHGVRSGSWVDRAIGGFAVSMDALGLAVDPLGNLAAWGVSWLIEHVRPLREALDWLAGDPDQIRAHAQTWSNVAAAMGATGAPVAAVPTGWTGAAATAYRGRAGNNGLAMHGLARAAAGVSAMVEGAGMLVATVRSLVRDLVAQFVATLAVRLPQWAAAAGVTLGIATPAIALQVASLVARYVGRIKLLLQALVASMRRLSTAARELSSLTEELSTLTRTRSGSAAMPTGPSQPNPARTRRRLEDPPPIPIHATYSTEAISSAERTMIDRAIVGRPRPLGLGRNGALKVDFTDGTHGVFKPISSEVSVRTSIRAGDMAYREVAASRLNEMLGFDLVPPTTLREVGPHGPGSMQAFVPSRSSLDVGSYPQVQEERMAVLDYVIGNTDRHPGNYRTAPDGGLVAIDHGYAFPTRPYYDPIISKFVGDYMHQDLSPAVVDAVRAADPERVRAALHGSGLEPEAIAGALDRLREVQANGRITGEAWLGRITDWHFVDIRKETP